MIHNLIVLWDEKLKKANLKQLLLAEFDQRCLINQSHWCQQSLIRVSGTWLRHDGGRRITWKMPNHCGQHYVPLWTAVAPLWTALCTTMHYYGHHYVPQCSMYHFVPIWTALWTALCTTMHYYGHQYVPLYSMYHFVPLWTALCTTMRISKTF